MDFLEFKELSKKNNVIPVYERMTADLLTPVLAYLKVREKGKASFLLESVEGIGRLARYSFIAKNPSLLLSNDFKTLNIIENNKQETKEENIFEYLQKLIAGFKFAKVKDLPDFSGGIVGYLGFENISLIEDVIRFNGKKDFDAPYSMFGLYKNIITFDHFKHQILLISNVFVKEDKPLEEQFNSAKEEIKKLKQTLAKPLTYKTDFKIVDDTYKNSDGTRYKDLVTKCKSHIFNGDVFQIVPSQRFSAEYEGDPLNVYRALRIINPSPYMYYMEFPNDQIVIGTSPEDLLKVKDRKAEILPIAGTRKRGKTVEEDPELEKELLADPKELAEHVMLVDLARNDLGRVSKYGSVKVIEDMNINRFSHVMHIVSRVQGELEDDKDCIDALKAAFPAGTVTGAPKIKAIQLINGYEQLIRNVYAGAVGYIDFSGNLDLCIAIRTLFTKGNKIYWQAGAGIVADSEPESEFNEVLNKSAVLKTALKFAGELDENIGD